MAKEKAGRLAFRVLRGPLTIGDETYTDEYDDAAPAELVRLASHAHAAGVVEVTEGLDLSDVQSQEDGEAAWEAAHAAGTWQEGNVLQHHLGKAQIAYERAVAATVDAELDGREATEEELAAVADAEKALADLEADVQRHMAGGEPE